jgi:cysteine desulfurase
MGIYLDHNATTPVRPEVRALHLAVLDELRGNPSSLHGPGRRARQLLDEARERTAAALGVDEEEVVFTSGGTEANNLALLGVVRAAARGDGLVTTATEHSSVLGPTERLGQEGHFVEVAPVDAHGLPSIEDLLRRAQKPHCRLMSVTAANNEVGACPDLQALGTGLASLSAEERPYLHTDAAQALGRVALDLRGWNIDLASFSGHKLGGPIGVGVLYRRRGVPLEPLAYGGDQEHTVRPGTENVAAIAATALAIELAVRERAIFAARLDELARTFMAQLARALPKVRMLGPPLESSTARLPGTLSLLVPHVDGKVLVTRLDLEGLELSAGSACASGSLEPSHVLLAMGCSENEARAALRVSLGRTTTPTELQQAVEILRKTIG